MKTKDNIEYWELIAKYYSNECTQYERKMLFKWLDEDEDNYMLFVKVKQDLEIINVNKSMKRVNVDSAWEKLKNRIGEDEDLPIEREFKVTTLLKYAAAIIIFVGIGFLSNNIYYNFYNDKVNVEYATLEEQGKKIILSDGSTVILNSDSKLTYPKTFASVERKVVLEGEAFFDVTKNPDLPFIIEAKDAEVKVLGTSFNVNATIPGGLVEVFVETGMVQLSRKKNTDEKVLINPGDVGVLSNNKIVKDKNNNENIIAWKTKEIIFHENELEEVLVTLNNVYKTNIKCENQDILDLRYTSTFRNQEIDSILNIICLTFNLKVSYDESEIYLVKYDI